MKIKAIIFDLDGTLTEPILDFDRIREEMGLEGVDILSAIQEMDPCGQQRANAILERHERYAAVHSRLNDGVKDLLDELHRRGLSIGLLTRNTRENAMQIAQKHRLKFDGIVDRQHGPVKPDAYGVLELCSLFGAPPSETLVVGDFLHDLQAARNAGAIAVLIETHPKAEQFKAHADYSICRMSEVIALIDKLEHN
jgi:HAD superfamily hydrolase (TIGR01509 family)